MMTAWHEGVSPSPLKGVCMLLLAGLAGCAPVEVEKMQVGPDGSLRGGSVVATAASGRTLDGPSYSLPRAVMDISVTTRLTACDAGYGPLALTPEFFDQAEDFLPIYVSGRVTVPDSLRADFARLKAQYRWDRRDLPGARDMVPESWFLRKRDDNGRLQPLTGFSDDIRFAVETEQRLRYIPDPDQFYFVDQAQLDRWYGDRGFGLTVSAGGVLRAAGLSPAVAAAADTADTADAGMAALVRRGMGHGGSARAAAALPDGRPIAVPPSATLNEYEEWLRGSSLKRDWTRNLLEERLLAEEARRIAGEVRVQPAAYRIIYYLSAVLLTPEEAAMRPQPGTSIADIAVKAPRLNRDILERFIRLGWLRPQPGGAGGGFYLCSKAARDLLAAQQERRLRIAALACQLQQKISPASAPYYLTGLECRPGMPYRDGYRGQDLDSLRRALQTLAEEAERTDALSLRQTVAQTGMDLPDTRMDRLAAMPLLLPGCPFDPGWFNRDAAARGQENGLIDPAFTDKYLCGNRPGGGVSGAGWTMGYFRLADTPVLAADSGKTVKSYRTRDGRLLQAGLFYRQPARVSFASCRNGIAYHAGADGRPACAGGETRTLEIPQWGIGHFLQFEEGMKAVFAPSGALLEYASAGDAGFRAPPPPAPAAGNGTIMDDLWTLPDPQWPDEMAEDRIARQLQQTREQSQEARQRQPVLRERLPAGAGCGLALRRPDGTVYCR